MANRWILGAVGGAAVVALGVGLGVGLSRNTPPKATPTTTTAPAPTSTTTAPAPTTTTTAPTSAAVSVVPCPVPASDFAGTPYRAEPPPATLTVPDALVPPQGWKLFGEAFPGSAPSYLVAPAVATCQGAFASADDGMVMTATLPSNRSWGVTMVLRAGGVGPSTDLGCPYIPAVFAADQALRGSAAASVCAHPSRDGVEKLLTGVPNVYAAAVFVPGTVEDPHLGMSGHSAPTAALVTAQVSPPDSANGQMIACTLPYSTLIGCTASLQFFLARESAIGPQVEHANNLSGMQGTIAEFVGALEH